MSLQGEECYKGRCWYSFVFKARLLQKVLSLVCQSLFAFLPKYKRVGKLDFDYPEEASKDNIHLMHNSC